MTDRRFRLALIVIMIAAVSLRLYWIGVADPSPRLEGGDGPFYLTLGRSLALGEGVPDSWSLAVGPVYPIYLAFFYAILPVNLVVQAARVGQAIIDSLMCAAVYGLAARIFDKRCGLLAGGVLALDPRFIVQTGSITTETVFIFFLMGGVWAFVSARTASRWQGRGYAAAAVLLVSAALTRAAALPLLVLYAGSLLLPKPSRRQLVQAAIVAGLGVVLAGGWMLKTYRSTGQLVVISDGLGGNFWMGSRSDGQWHGQLDFQRELDDLKARYGGRAAYIEDALKTIAGDPAAYARLLVVKAGRAYLQPSGTVAFPGESLKEMALEVLNGRARLGDLLNGESFWPKLMIYLFHYVGLIGGVVGLWLSRREWIKALPLLLPIVYFSAAYTVLTIIPRYLLPVMPFYMILAAYAAVALYDRRRQFEPRSA